MKPALVVAMILVAASARTTSADMWRDYGSWTVREPTAFGCQHRESLSPLSEYARGNDHDGFERALREQMMSGECALLQGGAHVLIYENLPRDDLRRIRQIGDGRFLWLPFNVVHQAGTP
jgi:hypothetical protein